MFHDADQRSIPQTDQGVDFNTVQEHPGFRGCQHRRLADLGRVLRVSNGTGRIPGQNLTDQQIVKQYPDRRQMLLDCGRHKRVSQLLDIGRYHHGFHALELKLMSLTGDCTSARAMLPAPLSHHGRTLMDTTVQICPGVHH